MEQKKDKTKELERLKKIQSKFGITEQMLSDSEADLNPKRQFQGRKQKKK